MLRVNSGPSGWRWAWPWTGLGISTSMSPPSLSRRNVILLIVASLTSLLFLGSLLSSSHFPMSTDFHSLHHIFSPPPYPWLSPSYPHNRPRMIIMQHFSWHDARAHRMQDASIAQHERYTHFWGYGYVKSDRQYVEGWRHERLRYMNKMYALLGVVLEQQAMGDEGAEWIYMTDADVMIRNPQIPVHALLPLSPSHTNATVVGCEDWNGFNAGNIIYRVSLETIAFLSHVLALTDEQTRAYIAAGSPVPPDPEGEGTDPDQIPGQVDGVELPPSDQRAQCLVLERMEAYGNRFYAMPDEWLNAYPWYDRNELQLNTHFVGGNKYTDDVDNYVELEKAQLRMLKSMSKGEVRQEEQKWAELAGQYWAGVRVGAPKCDWI